MTDSQRQTVQGGDEQAKRVRRNLACVGCGYNLRTLPLNHRCPECGTEVMTSCQSHRRGLPACRRSCYRSSVVALLLAAVVWSLRFVDTLCPPLRPLLGKSVFLLLFVLAFFALCIAGGLLLLCLVDAVRRRMPDAVIGGTILALVVGGCTIAYFVVTINWI